MVMADGYSWEEFEVRTVDGTVVRMVRLDFEGKPVEAVEEQVTLICRWCGQSVLATPSAANPWKHEVNGMIICRDEAKRPVVPVTVAEPTVWGEGEVTW